MGGGEPDRPSRSAGMRTRRGPAGIDRRTFIRRAGRTGVAAGALVWSTPRISSVGAQAAAGSPPPSTTDSTTDPTVLAGGGSPSEPGASELAVKGVQADPPGGSLAITGAELGHIAALGGASVGMGELLRRKGLHRRQALEADAALYGDVTPADGPATDGPATDGPPPGDSPDPA
jgi:hypothetical protein